jgi:hypothetical protein
MDYTQLHTYNQSQLSLLQLQLTLTTELQLLLSLPRASFRPKSLRWLFSEDCHLTSELPWLYSLGTDRIEDTFSERIPKNIH